MLDLSTDEIESVLTDGYGLAPDDVVLVSGEVATVCRIRVGDTVLAVKSEPSTPASRGSALWQSEVVDDLHRKGLPVPQIVKTRGGELAHESVVGGQHLLTVVSDWLPDPPLSDVDVDDHLLAAVGATAGRLSLALSAAAMPSVAPAHQWELTRSAESVRTVLSRVADPHVAKLAARTAQIFDETLHPLLPQLPRSIVHHDLHDSNLLIGTTAAGRRDVTGILDFGDMTVAPRVAELAVTAAYAARNTFDPAPALLSVVTGWARTSRLTRLEARAVLPAAQSRLALNAAIWASRLDGTRTGYAYSRMSGTVATLEKLLCVDATMFEEEAWTLAGDVREAPPCERHER